MTVTRPNLVTAPFSGRATELSRLYQAFEKARDTTMPQTVTILGPSGAGATRLLDEFAREVTAKASSVRLFRATVREHGPSLGALQKVLRARFGIHEGDIDEESAQRIRVMVSDVLGDRRVSEFIHYLGDFLEVQFPDSPLSRALDDDPIQSRQVGRAVLRRFIEVDAEKEPLVLIFDDVHAAHADLLDLLEYLIHTLRGSKVFIACAARPKLVLSRSTWFRSASHHERIDLGPLHRDAAAMLIRELSAPAVPAPSLIDKILDVSRCLPLFIERAVAAVREQGLLESTAAVAAVSADQTARLELQVADDSEALGARLAALSPAERALLETSSCIGQVFWVGALVAVARQQRPAPELWGGVADVALQYRDTLAALAARDYVRPAESSLRGEEAWEFVRPIEWDSVSRAMRPADQSRLHDTAAQWLEFRAAERSEEHQLLIANHYEWAGKSQRSAVFLLRAGDLARARWANERAIEYYEKGLSLLSDADVRMRVDALHNYGDVLQTVGRNDEALDAFRRMLELAFRLDIKAKGGAAHNRIGRLYRAIGHLDEAMRHLGTGHALFEAAGDTRGVASSLDDVGKVHWMRGAYEAAENFMSSAIEMRTKLGDKRSIALSHNNLGLVYQDSGRFQLATDAFHRALSLRSEIGDLPGIAQTLNNLGTIHQDNSEHEQAVVMYEEALEVAQEVGDRMRQSVILTNLGESRYRMGQPDEAIRVLGQAEDLSATLGDWILEGEILRGLAKAHLLIGDHSLASGYVERAIELLTKARGKPFLGVALRTKGEIAAALGDTGKARVAFTRALELFEELGNDLEVARTCQSFASFLEAATKVPRLDAQGTAEAAEWRAEARDLRARGESIHTRSRNSSAVLPLDGDKTDPNHKLS